MADRPGETWIELLRRQQATGFPEIAGTELAATIPLSDRLLNQIVAASLSDRGPLSEVRIQALAGNAFAVRLRLARARFLPAIDLTIRIARQPDLPEHPVLVLQVAGGALTSMASTALRFLDVLPPGVRLEGDLAFVQLGDLLASRGLAGWLAHLQELRLTSEPGRAIVALRARVGPRGQDRRG